MTAGGGVSTQFRLSKFRLSNNASKAGGGDVQCFGTLWQPAAGGDVECL
jgi:hypothetical protein